MTPEERKIARREVERRYRQNNPTAYKAKRQRFREKHRERLQAEEREYYLANREERLQLARDRYRTDPERYVKRLLAGARNRARSRGLEFSITKADVVIPDICPILGLRLGWGVGSPIPSSPSLDRIDSTKGYVVGNVRVISHRANSLKSNISISEVRSLLTYMESLTLPTNETI